MYPFLLDDVLEFRCLYGSRGLKVIYFDHKSIFVYKASEYKEVFLCLKEVVV